MDGSREMDGVPRGQTPVQRELAHADEPAPTPTAVLPAARFGIAGHIYHQVSGEPAVSVDFRFGRWLELGEHPYQRPLSKCDETWKPLDLGWLADGPVSLIIIENVEGRFTQVIPKPEQVAEAEAKVIEIGVTWTCWGVAPTISGVEPFQEVRPSNKAVVFPVDPKKLRIRCRSGVAKYNLHVFPG